MKLLTSKKLKLPDIFLITDRSKIKELPIGVPFIYADETQEENIIRVLEFEILYQSAKRTGYPFDFKKLLAENGYNGIEYWFNITSLQSYIDSDYESSGGKHELDTVDYTVTDFIKDTSCYVDIESLKDLNIFPIWFDKLEKALEVNIQNFAMYDYNLYNKKLEGVFGAVTFTAPNKNLIIIDISGSIPKAVSSTILTMCKNLAESFYADILITGSKSTLYTYEMLHELSVEKVYKDNGMDNDQIYFKELVTSEEKHYGTCIVFGDNHSPCARWNNKYNNGSKEISKESGKKMCKWTIDKVISFHASSNTNTAGYADWFQPKEVEIIKNWVKYLN